MNNEDKLLIVDDNTKNIQVLATVLSNNGYDIEYALRGKDAINLVDTENFDLILLDIMMPEMDGFKTCEILKKKQPDIPIIFITAKTDIGSVTKGFDIGGVDYITKPFNEKELIKRVETHLELKKSRERLLEVNMWLENQVEERTKELKKAKLELEELNTDLLKVDQAKTHFLSLISHEIRTPLNGISGFLYLLKKQNKIDGLEKYINPLDISVKRLEEFSNKALLLTRIISSSKSDLEMKELNLNELVMFSINNLSSFIEKQSVSLNINNLEKDIHVRGDDDYLLQSIEYIIENAIEFSPKESEIIIQSKIEEEHIILEIMDNGPGFSENILKNGFQIFAPEKHIDKNLGLSLKIVKIVMEKHSGQITLDNTDKGGKVCFFFKK